MEEEGYDLKNYKVEDIYQGGYSSIDPTKGNFYPSSRIPAGDIGMATDARSANIVKIASQSLNAGAKNIELTQVSPEVFDAIPQEQFKEAKRMFELTGVQPSFHAPVVEPTGFTKEGWSESDRQAVERQMVQSLERSHDMDPNGNLQVTFHSTAMLPGSEFKPGMLGKEGGAKKLILVDRESGKMAPAEEEERYYPEHKKIGKMYSAEKAWKDQNSTMWDDQTSQILMNKENADRIIESLGPMPGILKKRLSEIKDLSELKPTEAEAYNRLQISQEFISHSHKQANALFNKAYKYAKEDNDQERMKALNELAEKYRQVSRHVSEEDAMKMSEDEGKKAIADSRDPVIQSQAINLLVNTLRQEKFNPNLFLPVEDFAVKQASKTFGNVALKAYKDFGDTAPIIGIENPPAGGALATGEDLRNLVEASRKEFQNKAMLSMDKGGLGMSESDAKNQAEKMLGVTWDVGHINMLKKQGFSDEDIVNETEKIAGMTKHVHLSDNFGFEHTELPMGMGNVPIKEMMKKLGDKGFEGKKVIEALSWWQHFSENGANPPLQPTLEAMGSPIYSMNMGPSWNQSYGLQQSYFGGYGMMLPEGNFNTFGAGFSQLPAELGGQRAGAQGSRTSGRPME